MSEKLHFNLVSPERQLMSTEVDQVVVPGTEGDFGVLPRHAPLMSTIRMGAVTVMNGTEKTRIFVNGGFADVTPEGLTILAEEALLLADIDRNALANDLAEAREDINLAKSDTEREAAVRAVARFEALETALAEA